MAYKECSSEPSETRLRKFNRTKEVEVTEFKIGSVKCGQHSLHFHAVSILVVLKLSTLGVRRLVPVLLFFEYGQLHVAFSRTTSQDLNRFRKEISRIEERINETEFNDSSFSSYIFEILDSFTCC